ncbi:hypothetical protein K469DRAFT_810885 [Zopfia rhizophila CBS 207.26]|uniref:Uncharacterized protein n=1 Tax=Zopfia rhizophila CBS 207.26 TaxID=1314779 RepID=A0A6A6DH78_9PEZI|nr:hypothetical protein K469DRAFT_810885 [Zopfia rhizophila CBS 207.26]
MSHSYETKDAILPTTEQPIPPGNNNNREDSGPTLKLSDGNIEATGKGAILPASRNCSSWSDGKGVDSKGEFYSTRKLESLYRKIPPQSENTVRVMLDGRSLEEVSSQLPGYSSSPECSVYLKRSKPEPCPLYYIRPKIDEMRYFHPTGSS